MHNSVWIVHLGPQIFVRDVVDCYFGLKNICKIYVNKCLEYISVLQIMQSMTFYTYLHTI